jgi:hypothetical protein
MPDERTSPLEEWAETHNARVARQFDEIDERLRGLAIRLRDFVDTHFPTCVVDLSDACATDGVVTFNVDTFSNA